MNKSNVSEIKKTLKITQEFMPSIETVCTCLVNGEKNKLVCNTESYASLDEEEQFKYIEIFKNVLSGAIGKKLTNLEYNGTEACKKAQDTMLNTHGKMFKDNVVRDKFFDRIIENYEFGENYLIVVGHGIYDVPVKASDGAKLEDETDTYDFMITAICPIHSTKAGLTFDPQLERMVSSKQVQIVEAPINGFLYPSFNERTTDIHELLYFSKKPEEQHDELIEVLTGKNAPTSCVKQQMIFENILAKVTDDKADFELIKSLHESLQEKAENKEMNSNNSKMSKEDIKEILEEVGVPAEKLNDFEHVYEYAGGENNTEFEIQNLITLDKFNVKAPDVEIKIKPDRTELVQKKKIDGRNCIVVMLEGDVELNGIQVSGI